MLLFILKIDFKSYINPVYLLVFILEINITVRKFFHNENMLHFTPVSIIRFAI